MHINSEGGGNEGANIVPRQVMRGGDEGKARCIVPRNSIYRREVALSTPSLTRDQGSQTSCSEHTLERRFMLRSTLILHLHPLIHNHPHTPPDHSSLLILHIVVNIRYWSI